jgi:hypothetical protein
MVIGLGKFLSDGNGKERGDGGGLRGFTLDANLEE